MSEFARDAHRACEKLLDARVKRTVPPGGQRRKSIRAFLEDRSVIITRRKHRARAELEVGVLRELQARGASVPRVTGPAKGGPQRGKRQGQHYRKPRRSTWSPGKAA
jgi:hypothetical protein